MPLRDEWDILDRIRAYTRQPATRRSLRQEWLARERVLGCARELERVAAELQQIADELREAV